MSNITWGERSGGSSPDVAIDVAPRPWRRYQARDALNGVVAWLTPPNRGSNPQNFFLKRYRIIGRSALVPSSCDKDGRPRPCLIPSLKTVSVTISGSRDGFDFSTTVRIQPTVTKW